MKRVNIGFCIAILMVILVGCQTNKRDEEVNSENENMLSTEKIDSNERQFVCKANMEMQVKNCLASINLIEQKAKEKKGFILKSELIKNSTPLSQTVISSDSIKQIATCITSADMVLRVPDTTLQPVLQYIENLGQHVTARVINKTDVSFDLKLNALNQKSGIRQTAVLSENGTVENKILTSNESIVADLSLKDAVNFSTIGIKLQQPEEILTTVVVNKEATYTKADVTFSRAWYNIQKGFFTLCNFLIYLLQLWWLVPVFFIGKCSYIFGKKYFSKPTN